MPKPKVKAASLLKPAPPPDRRNLLIVGLGNPGDKYKLTRHNIGFLVTEELARRHSLDLKVKSAFQGEYAAGSIGGKSVGILRPATFMNLSGQAARKVMDWFKLPATNVLVVVDEVALEVGQLRMRGQGSSGGHNGLKSMEACLKTQEYPRLRIGVGGAGGNVLSDHVLSDFSRQEQKALPNIIADACDMVEYWIQENDMAKVMTRCNAVR